MFLKQFYQQQKLLSKSSTTRFPIMVQILLGNVLIAGLSVQHPEFAKWRMCGNQILYLKAFLPFWQLDQLFPWLWDAPSIPFFFSPCMSSSSLCYKQPTTTSLVIKDEYEGKVLTWFISWNKKCCKSCLSKVSTCQMTQFNSSLLARARHAHREEQGLPSPASRAGRAVFHWTPWRGFVICSVSRVISDAYAVSLGSGNNALLSRAVQARDLGLIWN